MKKSPLVSVLITAYNREKYIGEAISSVRASTYTNFELIIVDDCSSDGTVDIARRHAAEDPRIRVYLNETNLTDYRNRNRAATYALGEYIKYVDSDDYIYPWGLQLLVQMMEEYPEAGWGLCGLSQSCDSPYPILLSPSEAYRYNYFGPGLFQKSPLSAIIKTEVFNTMGGFNPARMTGDFDLWHRLGRNYPVLLMPDGIVWNRVHSEQESTLHGSYGHAYESIRNEYINSASCPLDSSERAKALRARKRILFVDMLSMLARFKFDEAVKKYQCLRVYFK